MQCAVCSVQCAVYMVKWDICDVGLGLCAVAHPDDGLDAQLSLKYVQYELVCGVQCILSRVQGTVYSVQCAVYSMQCSMCSVQCTLFSVQCIVCSVQCVVSAGQGVNVR